MDSLPVFTSSRSPRAWLLVQLAAGILIGLVALVWAMRGLDLHLVLHSLATAHYRWVLASLACVLGVALLKAVRWNALYAMSERHTSFADVFSALMISQMVNVLIPIRMGELVRIGLMKQSGQPGAATLSTIVIEKALDLVATGLIAVSLVVLAMAPVWMQEWSRSVLLIGLTLMIGLVLVWCLRGWMEKVLARALAFGGWLSETWQKRLLRVTHTTLYAFGALTDLKSLVLVLFWTSIIWFFSLLTMVTLFAAFGMNVPVSAAVVVMLAMTFSSIVPSPPALVGVMQSVAIVVLGEYGVAQPVALGFGIVLNVVTVAPLIVLGSLAFCQRTISSVYLVREYPWRELWKNL